MFTQTMLLFLIVCIANGFASPPIEDLPLKKRSMNENSRIGGKSIEPIKKTKAKKQKPTDQRHILKRASIDLDLSIYIK